MNQISFFVSSTFKDMQGERDALHRVVMPEIREFANSYGRDVSFVDLRWGISTDNLESDKSADKILKVCLDEIEDCSPYQIIILGERYGWIPSINEMKETVHKKNFEIEEEISITELEILYGMWKNKGRMDKCIFCIRESIDSSLLKEEERDIYTTSNEDDKRRMEKLKEKIKNTSGVKIISYSVDMRKERDRYEDFVKKITERIKTLLLKEWGTEKKKAWIEKEFENERLMTDQFIDCFSGRETELHELEQRLSICQLLISTVKGGIGTSSIMAKLGERFKKKGYRIANIYCGNSYCFNTLQLLKIMCAHLEGLEKEEEYSMSEPGIENEDYWKEKWDRLTSEYQGDKILFLIDGIHHLHSDQRRENGDFLPSKGCSNKIGFMLTTNVDTKINPLAVEKVGRWCDFYGISECSEEDLRSIIYAKMKEQHKDISEKVMNELLAHPLINNMMCMEMILQDILMMDHEDFDNIRKLEESMDGNTAIDAYLCSLIKKHPHEENRLIEHWYLRMLHILAERDRNEYHYMFYMMLGLILSVNGITPEEMMDLSEYVKEHFPNFSHIQWFDCWEESRFVRIRRYMGKMLHKTTDGRYRFAHSQIRSALFNNETARKMTGGLMAYYASLPDSSILKQENMIPSFFMYIRERSIDEIKNNEDKYCFSFLERMINLRNSEDKEEALRGRQVLNRMADNLRTSLLYCKNINYAEAMFQVIQLKAEEGKTLLDKELAFFIDDLYAKIDKNSEYEKSIMLSSYLSLAIGYEKWIQADEKYKMPEIKKFSNKIGRFKEWTPLERRILMHIYTRACELYHSIRIYINKKENVIPPKWDWGRIREKAAFYINVLSSDTDVIRNYYCAKIMLMDSDHNMMGDPKAVMEYLPMAKNFIKRLMESKYDKEKESTKFVIRCYVDVMTEISKQYVYLAKSIEDIHGNPNYKYLYGDAKRTLDKMIKQLEKKKYINTYLDLEKLQIIKYCVSCNEVGFYYFDNIKQDFIDSMWELQKNMRAEEGVMDRAQTREEVKNGAVVLMEFLLQGYIPKPFQEGNLTKKHYINMLLSNEAVYMLAMGEGSTNPKDTYHLYLIQALCEQEEVRETIHGWDKNVLYDSIRSIESVLKEWEGEDGVYIYKLKWLLEWFKKQEKIRNQNK